VRPAFGDVRHRFLDCHPLFADQPAAEAQAGAGGAAVAVHQQFVPFGAQRRHVVEDVDSTMSRSLLCSLSAM
jgi:shikimate 5-dehydrogenase